MLVASGRTAVGEAGRAHDRMLVLARASAAIAGAQIPDEAAGPALDAAAEALSCNLVALQVWRRHSRQAEFELARTTQPGLPRPSPEAVAGMVATEARATGSRARVEMLGNARLRVLFPGSGQLPYRRGLLLVRSNPQEGLLKVFLACSRHSRQHLRTAVPFIDTLLTLVDLSWYRIRAGRNLMEEHKRVVQAKREWQRSVDALSQLICLVDASGRVMRANRALEELGLGRVTQVCGQSITGLLEALRGEPQVRDEPPLPNAGRMSVVASGPRGEVGDDSSPDLDWMRKWRAIQDREPVQWILVNPVRGRSYRITMQRCTLPEAQGSGQRRYAVVVIEDVTERRKAERLLADYRAELECEVRQKTTQLVRTNGRLRKLSRELIQTEEKERKRVAGELHDGIGQMLTAIKLGLENCQGQLAAANGSRGGEAGDPPWALGKIREAIEEVRRISMDLRPSLLDDLGVVATLRWFFREQRQLLPGIDIQCEIEIAEEHIPAPLKTVIFRVTQEALTNISRHADATRIRFRLDLSASRLRLRISDNGRGFDPSRVGRRGSGSGLNNMRERATLSGGELDIGAAVGAGVWISADWPLEA